MAREVPPSRLVLVSTNVAAAIMGIARVDGCRHKEVGNLVESRLLTVGAVDVDAVLGQVMNLSKQVRLVDELIVPSQPSKQYLAQAAAPGVVIGPFRMQQRCDPMPFVKAPSQWHEALIKIGLNPLQQRVVLHRIQEILRTFGLL